MADPTITLTTDFGEGSPYVAAMKGVILGVNPSARLVDLSHQIPPQDLRHSAFFLASALPYFPAGAIHVVVVDPGVGTERAMLLVETGGQRLLVPDNGCWTKWARAFAEGPRVRRLQEARFWRRPLSNTFHGRDILAPVAGHLSLGIDAALLGPVVQQWVVLPEPRLEETPNRLVGEVEFVDGFGNLITNIPASDYQRLAAVPVRISVGSATVATPVRTYADAEPQALVVLISSGGMLEIAVNQGNAARRLGVGVGAAVEVAVV